MHQLCIVAPPPLSATYSTRHTASRSPERSPRLGGGKDTAGHGHRRPARSEASCCETEGARGQGRRASRRDWRRRPPARVQKAGGEVSARDNRYTNSASRWREGDVSTTAA